MALTKIQKLKIFTINKINFVIQKKEKKIYYNQALQNWSKFLNIGFSLLHYSKIVVLAFNLEK